MLNYFENATWKDEKRWKTEIDNFCKVCTFEFYARLFIIIVCFSLGRGRVNGRKP